MDDSLFFLLLILAVLAFITVIPALLWTAMKRIADPVPLRLPLSLAAGVLLVLLVIPVISPPPATPGPDPLEKTLVMFCLMFLLTVLAVISPYAIMFGKRTGTGRPWLSFSLLSFIGIALLFLSTMSESREGAPLPLFGPRLPLTGWIIDGIASLIRLQDIVYSPGSPGIYTVLLAAGLFLEVFIIATVYYALLSVLPPAPDEQSAGNGK